MTVVLTVVAVLAGLAGAAALWGISTAVGDRWGPVVATTGGLGVAGVIGVGALVVLWVSRQLDLFGVIHLAYLLVCVAVPLLGAALAARTASGAFPAWTAALAAGLLLPVPLGWYATHVAPYRLVVDRVTVPVDAARAGTDPLRLGVLADLQTNDPGPYEHRAVDRLLAAEPDVILLPGDLFQGTRRERERHREDMRDLLARLEAPGGVYFAGGDTDGPWRAADMIEGTGIVPLDDEIVEVIAGDRRLLIGGNRLHYRSAQAAAMREDLASARGGDAIRILLAHRPDVVLQLEESSPIDLTVAGHTHGGQVALPWVGPLVTLSEVPRQVAAGGLHRVAGNDIFVSTGVGLERGQAPQVRLLARPTVGIVDLVEPGFG